MRNTPPRGFPLLITTVVSRVAPRERLRLIAPISTFNRDSLWRHFTGRCLSYCSSPLLLSSSPPLSSPLQMSNPNEQMGGGEERQLVAPLCRRPSVPLPPISHPPALCPSHHTVSVTVMILIFPSSASFAPLHTFPPVFAPPAPSITVGMTKYTIKLEQI